MKLHKSFLLFLLASIALFASVQARLEASDKESDRTGENVRRDVEYGLDSDDYYGCDMALADTVDCGRPQLRQKSISGSISLLHDDQLDRD